MKKQHIIGALILLVIAALVGFKYYSHVNPEVVESLTPTTEKTVENGQVSTTSKTEEVVTPEKSVNVITVAPINGTYKGVVEVGASGFNSFVINIDKDKNWELVSKEFGQSLAYEGFATTDDVKTQLKKYLSRMFEKGVAGRNAHFVMSSGALKNPKTELIAKSIEQMGYVVNRVNADQEGKYALKALLPKEYRDNSFVIDIGSGNTKVSWYQNGKMTSIETYGAKYYQNGVKDPQVYDKVKDIVNQVPADLRKNCFIIGGVPFKLASESRKGEERFTFLKNPDEYSSGDDVKFKSGLNIYRSIFENSGCNAFIFDWDANFTIGFLMTLN